MREVPNPTPGEILLEEFLNPMGITPYGIVKQIGGRSGVLAKLSWARVPSHG